MTIKANRTLGELATAYPNVVSVFNKYKLDYCCGGKDLLQDAAKAQGLDVDVVLEELKLAAMHSDGIEKTDWESMSLTEIVDYIIDKHHSFVNVAFEELNVLMYRILKVHYRTNGESLLKVHKLFGTLKTELEAHLVKEEENLFPIIRAYDLNRDDKTRQSILKFIANTEDEHDAAGDLFKALEIATNDFTPPEDACLSYTRAFALLDQLEKDTFNHIHIENTVLFGRI